MSTTTISVEEMAAARLIQIHLKASLHGGTSLHPPPWKLFRVPNGIVRSFSSAISPASKAVVYEEQGPPDAVCKLKELPPVPLKDDDVCVRMLAAPINPSDINRIEGLPLFFSTLCMTHRLFHFTALMNCTLRM